MFGFIFRIIAFLKWLLGFETNPYVHCCFENQLPALARLCQGKKAAVKNPQCSDLFHKLANTTLELQVLLETLRTSGPNFDIPNTETPANGYRSFVKIVDQASLTALDLLSSNTKLDVLQELSWLFESLSTFAAFLVNLMNRSESGSLFPPVKVDDKAYTLEILELIRNVKLQSFYGRFIANHFDQKLKFSFKRLSEIMVSYGQWYHKPMGLSLLRRIFNCLTNDQSRGAQHVELVEHAGIDFIKSFWALSESPFMMLPMRVTNPIAVSYPVDISKETVTINGIEVRPTYPAPVTGRLISKTFRQGMPVHRRGAAAERSRGLLLHVHGGGFVSQSAQSQEIFLRKWAFSLDVPVFSIDYSLAPDAAFPQAVHQVFYSYCVAIAYSREFLGSTAERVVFAGDSAGGNIILGAMQLCIERGIRLPDGLLLAYVPLFVSMLPSPSRLLSLMDPLLPYGLMMRCAKAYISGDGSGGDFESLLDVTFPQNPLVSPYICPDDVLQKLPFISLYTSTLDPCLDDAIMFTKKLKKLGNEIHLDVADRLPHGFLNLCWVTEETRAATRISCERISAMLNREEKPKSI